MKKSIAALSAGVLGLVGAGVVAAPAVAVAPDCASTDGHQLKTSPADGDWIMECTPLYGFGKAEFTLTSATEFAPSFDVANPTVATLTSTVPDAAASAYTSEDVVGGFWNLEQTSTTATQQRYSGWGVYPITSAVKVAPEQLPLGCDYPDVTYDGAYKITYAPVTTVIATTPAGGHFVNGAPAKYVLRSAPAPIFIALNFNGDSIESADPICVSGSTGTSYYPNYTAAPDFYSEAWYRSSFALSPASILGYLPYGTLAESVPPTVSTSAVPVAVVGGAYYASIVASGDGPITYSATGLPTGISINPTTGVISGTTATPGAYPVTVTATSPIGAASKTFTLSVAPLDSAVTVTAATTTYGTSATAKVAVTSDAAAASGSVVVSVDGTPLAPTALSAGAATVALPATLDVGAHTITASFTAAGTSTPKYGLTTLKIGKAATDTVLKLSKKSIKKSASVKATITVKSAATPTGKVAITVNGKTVKTVSLKNGKATVTLPKFSSKGTKKVVAKYLGTDSFSKDSSKTATVKVK